MLTYLHPLVAAAVLGALVFVASRAIRSRTDHRHREELLAVHARWAPVLYGLMLVTWVGGLGTTWWLRPERHLATSGHFRISLALMGVLTGSALSSRFMSRDQVRWLHPWFGGLALLLAAAQVFFGLQIMP